MITEIEKAKRILYLLIFELVISIVTAILFIAWLFNLLKV